MAFSTSKTDNEQLTFAVTGGHSYLLEVVGKNGATSPQYRLTIDGPAPTADAFEPNDSLAAATDLGRGDVESVTANIHESLNSDFYLWTPDANGVAIIDLLFQQIEGDLDLAFWADGTQIELAEFRWRQRAGVSLYRCRSDIRPGSSRKQRRYQSALRTADRRTRPGGGSLEPNDSPAEAAELGPGDVQLTGLNIHESGNSDFYHWSPSAAGPVQIDLLFSHHSGDVDLALWIDDIEMQLSDSVDDNEQLQFDIALGQQVIIEVRGKQEAVNPYYELQVDGPDAPRITSVRVAKAGTGPLVHSTGRRRIHRLGPLAGLAADSDRV